MANLSKRIPGKHTTSQIRNTGGAVVAVVTHETTERRRALPRSKSDYIVVSPTPLPQRSVAPDRAEAGS